jgi:hypothetical protein
MALGNKQQAKYKRILKNKGKPQAEAFKKKILSRNSGSVDGDDPSEGTAPQVQSAFSSGVEQKLAKADRLRSKGKYKKADKINRKIINKSLKNPAQGIDLGEYYADRDFNKNLQANRPNQDAIGGSREYVTNADGSVTVKDSFDAGQQGLYNQDIASRGAANNMFLKGLEGGQFGQAYDFSGLPQAPSTGDLAGERARIEDSVYDREAKFINRSADRRREQLEQRLYETGNPMGTPAYEKAMQQFNEGLSSELDDARSKATQIGGQEYERNFNIGSQARSTALGEQAFARSQPLNELSALQGFGGGPTTVPNFFQFQPIQYQGPQYLDYMNSGIDAELGRGALAVQRQNANRPRGFAPQAAVPQFSISGQPPSSAPNVQGAPSPVGSGFAQGVAAGIAGR